MTKVPTALCSLCMALSMACAGDDGDDDTTNASASASATATATATATDAETGAGTSSDGGEDETSTGSATGTATGTATVDPDTGSSDTGPSGDCDPAMSTFLENRDGVRQAAILVDLGAQACAAASAAGTDPQIVLDVKPTGLIDATLFGFEIVDVSSGQPFTDPPEGDSVVIDLIPDLPIELQATRVDDGTPVTISFEVFSTGPTLIDARVEL